MEARDEAIKLDKESTRLQGELDKQQALHQ